MMFCPGKCHCVFVVQSHPSQTLPYRKGGPQGLRPLDSRLIQVTLGGREALLLAVPFGDAL